MVILPFTALKQQISSWQPLDYLQTHALTGLPHHHVVADVSYTNLLTYCLVSTPALASKHSCKGIYGTTFIQSKCSHNPLS